MNECERNNEDVVLDRQVDDCTSSLHMRAVMTSYHLGSFPGSLPGLYPMVPGGADRENQVMRVEAAAGQRVVEHHGGVVEGAVRSTVKLNLATHVRLRSARVECQQ